MLRKEQTQKKIACALGPSFLEVIRVSVYSSISHLEQDLLGRALLLLAVLVDKILKEII